MHQIAPFFSREGMPPNPPSKATCTFSNLKKKNLGPPLPNPGYAPVWCQWRSEGNWRQGANLNFAPPPQKKFLKNDIKLSSIQLQ